MIDGRIFKLTPKRLYCPLCGKWHKWEGESLESYDEDYPYEYVCNDTTIGLWVKGDYICIESNQVCMASDDEAYSEIALCDIECDESANAIKFSIDWTTDIPVVCDEECLYYDNCNLAKIIANCDYDDEIKLDFKVEFSRQNFISIYKNANKATREKNPRQQHEEVQQQEEITKQCKEEEKHCYEEPVKPESKKTTNQTKEDTTMANNNIFNMNQEFGPNKDNNIASTLMGVAVKSGENWRIYDKKKREITDVGDMKLGNLPIFILPTTKLSEGDLIKDDGEYYFVIKVDTGSTQTLCAKTGEMKTVIPIKNVLGFSCYSKVIALSDSINMGGDFDVEKLAIMSAMCGQSGEDGCQMNQLLPLMLFKDKLGGDDDMMKMMLMTSMMSAPAEGGDQNATMNQLLPLMLFKDKLGGDDDMMKMMFMSSMMGGNMAGNNPAMSYLMLDMFMGKKEEKAQQPVQESPQNTTE